MNEATIQESRKELGILMNQCIPELRGTAAEGVLCCIEMRYKKSPFWCALLGFSYGIIWGKRIERARRQGRKAEIE